MVLILSVAANEGQFLGPVLSKTLMTPGTSPNTITQVPDTSTITASAPVSSISTGISSESPIKQKALQAGDSDRLPKKLNRGKGRLSDLKAPESSSVRRSPRHAVCRFLLSFSGCISLDEHAYNKDIKCCLV